MNQTLSTILAFTAGAIIVAIGSPYLSGKSAAGGINRDEVKEIVKQVIQEEPRLIVQSVQGLQQQERQERVARASDALKSEAVQKAMFHDENTPYIGPKEAKKVVVEFFDYNCPACKVQFTAVSELVKQHKDVKVIFKEYPIFGPQSDTNARLALAVNTIDRSKYLAFHEKMIGHQGRVNEAQALEYVKAIGLNPKQVQEKAKSDEINAILLAHRDLGNKISVQGTPTMVVGDKIFPHAVSLQQIKTDLNL